MRTDKGERGANSGSEDTKREQEQKRVTRSDVLRVHVVGPDFQDERCTEPSPFKGGRGLRHDDARQYEFSSKSNGEHDATISTARDSILRVAQGWNKRDGRCDEPGMLRDKGNMSRGDARPVYGWLGSVLRRGRCRRQPMATRVGQESGKASVGKRRKAWESAQVKHGGPQKRELHENIIQGERSCTTARGTTS
ncbi:hypothetical protein EDB84DRAFT_1628238 [Lactarius hengduanensis]|nr:hypothetical protein EDB84DRAFT_1628238 [Lactarius hengduanensis]